MKPVKSLLLLSVAGLMTVPLMTVAGARAADLPVKAAPVEYMKVCTLYGAGFFSIPGTDTCLKVGGYLRADHIYGMGNAAGFYMAQPAAQETRTSGDMYSYRARMNLTVDFRTQSDYGTIRAYAAIIGQQSQGDFAPTGTAVATGSAGILRAFVQFAGFTVGHAVSYFDFMNGADYGYVPPIQGVGTGVNGTDLIAYTWQISNGLSASIDIEDGGNGQNSALLGNGQPGTGRGKTVINASVPSSFGNAGTGAAVATDTLRAMQPDLAGNLRVDQAWGSAQIMAALHNASGGYYTNVPGATSATVGAVPPGIQVFGHPGEAWGWAVGGGAKFVNFLQPRDTLEFQASACKGAASYCFVTGLYGANWMYGRSNSVGMGYAVDGVFTNGSQVELSQSYSYIIGYQHYWNQQWRTAVLGGQSIMTYGSTAQSMLCGTAPGSSPALYGSIVGSINNCNPNFSQSALSTRTAWNPHPFLEIGLDLIWFQLQTANAGSTVRLLANGARPAGLYRVENQDGYMMALRFQKTILP